MRHALLSTAIILAAMAGVSCKNQWDLQPRDRISSDRILSSEDGARTWMANLYYQAPFEEFGFSGTAFHKGSANTVGFYQDQFTDNAINSQGNNIDVSHWWDYSFLRDVNYLLQQVGNISGISDDQRKEIEAEGHFLRGFGYFALVKRYGGVPIIREFQEYTSDPEQLKVPRSTEKETWDFVLEEFDKAIAGLPSVRTAADSRRATRWLALAMKARAALFAASIAKYGARDGLDGEAVSLGLVHMSPSESNGYYLQCIAACEEIIQSGLFGLYKPEPATPEEAEKNLIELFSNPSVAPSENMFIYSYGDPEVVTCHSYEFWCNSNQTRLSAPHSGRMNPVLDLVDAYEYYAYPGRDGTIVTRVDGNVTDYDGFKASHEYLRFDTPSQIFEGKDARLHATCILPGTMFRDKLITIQAGYVARNGSATYEGSSNTSVTVGDNTYYQYGAASPDDYSGFDQSQHFVMTRTGFSYKKFLSTKALTKNELGKNVNAYPIMRYAEILLTYAEAVFESGEGNPDLAKTCLNATRRRAGHTTEIPLTSENIQRERRVELAFENDRFWTLIRRREYQKVFNSGTRKALDPLLDLRVSPPKYIFVRKIVLKEVPHTWENKNYYLAIPGVASNGCIQNPQW